MRALPYTRAPLPILAPKARNKKRRQPCNGGGVHAASNAQVTCHKARNSRLASEKLGPPTTELRSVDSRGFMRLLNLLQER